MASKVLQLILVLSAVAVISVSGQRNIALSGPEFRRMRLGQNPDLLEFAAKTGERVIIVIDGPEILAVVQEEVNANLWCLPWLQRFPGGTIQWLFQRRDVITGETAPGDLLNPVIAATDPLINIGGDYNEWLNITRTLIAVGAASTSNGLYVCEVCLFRDTAFEECHLANTSLQVIGGPPILEIAPNNEPDSERVVLNMALNRNVTYFEYLIGSDFCIPPDFRGRVIILCVIVNVDFPNILNEARAFPVPFRSWSLNGDLLYSELSTTTPNIQDSMEFFAASRDRMVFDPTFFRTEPLLGTPTQGRQRGAIQLDFSLENATFIPMFSSLDDARAAAYRAVVGDWMCSTNNTFGSDMGITSIRLCGAPPGIRRCPSLTFLETGESVFVGCTVCIPEGAIITLNCSGTSDSDVFYEWRNSADIVVSTSPLFTTGTSDNFTCTATNADNDPEFDVSVIAYSDVVAFSAETTERLSSVPRMDNGCPRLRNPEEPENSSLLCAFVGETLSLNCYTDNFDMVPLEITTPRGIVADGNFSVLNVNVDDAGPYECRLSNTPGPCREATETIHVQIFDPATIDRLALALEPSLCTSVAGRMGVVEFRPVGSVVTLCCPYNGIDEPAPFWYRITVNDLGCASEVRVQEDESITITNDEVNNVLLLETPVNGDVTYVCRVSNRAGSDADIVSITTSVGAAPSWNVTEFSACDIECRDGVRRRSVVCRSGVNNMILPQSECGANNRPPNEESCAGMFPEICLLDPVWIQGEWGKCSKDCGGFREREVDCLVPMTGQKRPDLDCMGQARPIDTDFFGCPECCFDDEYPRYCKAGAKLGFCFVSDHFRQICCWSCGDTTIGGQ